LFEKDVITDAVSLHSGESESGAGPGDKVELDCHMCDETVTVGGGDKCPSCGHVFELTSDGFIKDGFIASAES